MGENRTNVAANVQNELLEEFDDARVQAMANGELPNDVSRSKTIAALMRRYADGEITITKDDVEKVS